MGRGAEQLQEGGTWAAGRSSLRRPLEIFGGSLGWLQEVWSRRSEGEQLDTDLV